MTKARDREHDEWIPWYVEDTPGWLELTLAARGAMEGIARKLNRKTGQLPLRRGLASLAVLLHVTWAELEPAIAELIAKGKVTWDGSLFVLADPEYIERKRRSGADRVAEFRARAKSQPPQPGPVTHVTLPVLHPLPALPVTDVTPVLVSSDLISSDLGSEIASGGSPTWFATAIDVIAMNTGVTLPVGEAWLRYGGARHNNQRGIAISQPDAQQWLTTVMVPEARELLRKGAREKDRDEAFRREKLGTAPKAQNSTKTFRERDEWAETAGPPDPETAERMKLLGFGGR